MLLRKEHIHGNGILGVWYIDESPQELLRLLPDELRQRAKQKLQTFKSDSRAKEWLAVRVMLYCLLGEKKIIKHTRSGRPQITDGSFQISISHSGNYAAILLHPCRRTGIDIEVRSNRVLRVAHRFVSPQEYVDETQKTLHLLLHWSAKETMFKRMHTSEINFKTHFFIEPFQLAASGEICAQESKTDQCHTFRIFYEVHPHYVMTWSLE